MRLSKADHHDDTGLGFLRHLQITRHVASARACCVAELRLISLTKNLSKIPLPWGWGFGQLENRRSPPFVVGAIARRHFRKQRRGIRGRRKRPDDTTLRPIRQNTQAFLRPVDVAIAGQSDAVLIDVKAASVVFRGEGAHAACFSPDGRWLVVGERLYHLRAAQAALAIVLDLPKGHVRHVAFTPDSKHLVTTCPDGTALAWDVDALDRRSRAGLLPLNAEQLWTLLADPNAAKAIQAMRALARTPQEAVRLIHTRLPPAARRVDHGALARLVADLDSPRFEARTAAEQRLLQLGDLAEAALREAAKESPRLEQRLRAERLLRTLETADPKPGDLRALRAVEVLEIVGTPEARNALERLATGAPRARLTREAKAALTRLRAP